MEPAPKIYVDDKLFEQVDFSVNGPAVGEYENCTFIDCNFSGSDLSGSKFSECEFTGCNLALIPLAGTALQTVTFRNSKLLGVRFDHCAEFRFAVEFDKCILNLSSFARRKLKGTRFIDCSLQDVDFSEADLTGATFENCDLQRALFEGTNLEKADFRTAYNYAFDPEINRMKRAKFSRLGLAGLLAKYDLKIE